MNVLSNIIEQLKYEQKRKQRDIPLKKRDYICKLKIEDRAVLLTGPRGVGKSSWLLSQIDNKDYLYFSADYPAVSTVQLYDLCNNVFMQGYEGVFIDEIHYAKDWAIQLKALYDSFRDKRIIACDSSSIVLRSGIADLSRRFVVYSIPLMSFREYAMIETDLSLPVINPFSYDEKVINNLFKKANILKLFNEYLAYGSRPFYLESKKSYLGKLMSTISKTLESDIPFLVPQLTENHLRLMNSVIGYLALSNIPVLQLNSLCRQWAMGKEKLYQLLYAMERAHLIRIVRKENDTKLHSVGAKIFLYDPSVYYVFGKNIGNIREAYTVSALSEAGSEVYAAKDDAEFDFIIDKKKIEVGGKKKNIKSADYVIRDNIDVPYDNVIPLWLLGFGY